MAPSLTESITSTTNSTTNEFKLKESAAGAHSEPLKLLGVLENEKFFEATTVIGREYEDVQIADLVNSPRRDEYIRDLAIIG
jgi:hypothetical protein